MMTHAHHNIPKKIDIYCQTPRTTTP